MTPKEKAKELVYKYENLVTTWDCYWDTEIPVENRLPEMKQCALIAVDEIIKVCENEISHCSDKTYFYWQEVKQEIEKL
jgi:hypothetical protein